MGLLMSGWVGLHLCPTGPWASLAKTIGQGSQRTLESVGGGAWLADWLTWAGLFCSQALQDASVLIFANKQDVKDSMSTAEISQFLTLSAIKDHPWHIQGCCALTGEGSVPHLSLAWPSQWAAGYRNPLLCPSSQDLAHS